MNSIENITLCEVKKLCNKYEHECIDCPLRIDKSIKFAGHERVNYTGCRVCFEPDDWELEESEAVE